MPCSVLLHHLTPDDRDHYDWLLAPGDGPADGRYDPDDRVLIAFRVGDRIDQAESGGGFDAERIEDHRWLYLSYEGEISGGRGRVERVASGIWTPRSIGDDVISGGIEWAGQAPIRFEGRRIDASRWRLQIDQPQRR